MKKQHCHTNHLTAITPRPCSPFNSPSVAAMLSALARRNSHPAVPAHKPHGALKQMEIRSKSEKCAIRAINSLEIKHGLLENTSAIYRCSHLDPHETQASLACPSVVKRSRKAQSNKKSAIKAMTCVVTIG